MSLLRGLLIGFFFWLSLWSLSPVAGLTVVKMLVLTSLFVIPAWGLIFSVWDILPKRFKGFGVAIASFLAPIPGTRLIGIVEPWFDSLIKSAQ